MTKQSDLNIKALFAKITNISNFKTIRAKLLSAFILTIIPVILLGVVSFSIAKNALEKKARESTIDTMAQTKNYLELMFSNIESLSMQLLGNNDLHSYLSGNIVDMLEKLDTKRRVDNIITNIMHNYRFISDINVIAKSGESITSSSNYYINDLDYDSFVQDSFVKTVSDAGGKLLFAGRHEFLDNYRTNNQKHIDYAFTAVRLLKNITTNSDYAYLFIDVKLSSIENLLNQLAEGSRGEYHLISSDGRVISSAINTGSEESSGDGESNEDNIRNEDFVRQIYENGGDAGSEFVDYKSYRRDRVCFNFFGTAESSYGSIAFHSNMDCNSCCSWRGICSRHRFVYVNGHGKDNQQDHKCRQTSCIR